jgi:hypothetical protein
MRFLPIFTSSILPRVRNKIDHILHRIKRKQPIWLVGKLNSVVGKGKAFVGKHSQLVGMKKGFVGGFQNGFK